jgi:hypothetical protein
MRILIAWSLTPRSLGRLKKQLKKGKQRRDKHTGCGSGSTTRTSLQSRRQGNSPACGSRFCFPQTLRYHIPCSLGIIILHIFKFGKNARNKSIKVVRRCWPSKALSSFGQHLAWT